MAQSIRRQLRCLQMSLVMLFLIVIALAASAFTQAAKPQNLGEITVERINVVDADGTLRLVISNKDRMHPGVIAGRTLQRPRPYAGILFFNDQGDAGSNTYDIGASIFSDDEVTLTRTGLNGVQVDHFETVTVNAGGAADQFQVNRTVQSTTLVLNGNGGPDTVTIASTGQAANVIVNGGPGQENVTVQSTGAGAVVEVNGGDVYLVPFGGIGGSGEARNLTPGRAASPAWLAWTSPTRLLVVELAGQDTAVTALDLPGGRASTLWHGPEQLSDGDGLGLSLGRDGHTSAVLRSDFGHPPEVWAGPLGAWKPAPSGSASGFRNDRSRARR